MRVHQRFHHLRDLAGYHLDVSLSPYLTNEIEDPVTDNTSYASEIFPLDIRMLCVSLTTADTWLGSFIIARSTPYMISDLGYGAYFFFASILVSMGIWSFFFVPETKGVSLEEMDELFMRPMHQAVWAQMRGKPLFVDEDTAARGKGLEKGTVEHVESLPNKKGSM